MLYQNHYLDRRALPFFTEALVRHFEEQPFRSSIALICVGSNHCARDSLGPKIGSRLQERIGNFPQIRVIGDYADPVHALNLTKIPLELSTRPKRSYVIAIDACLGEFYKIGTLQLVAEPLQPGSALGKSLPPVGDVHFKGIVNNYTSLNPEILEHPSLRFIDEMALVMSRVLERAVRRILPILEPVSPHDESE